MVPAPVLDASAGSASYLSGHAPVVVDPNLSLTGSDNLSGATVSITGGFQAGQDTLGFTSQLGITGSYNASSGILSLTGSGTTASYEAVLRSVTYGNGLTNPTFGTRTITFSVAPALYDPNIGHFYEFVQDPGISWTAARDSAQSRSLFGLSGYLTTITSAQENSFVKSKLQGQGWIGASDAANEGEWFWVTGPEAGTQFYRGVGYSGGTPVNGSYNNWSPGEPNDYQPLGGEDYGHLYSDGSWNDYPHQTNAISGYLVEYGGMPTDPVLQLTDFRDVSVSSNNSPNLAINSATINVNEGQTASNSGTWSDLEGETVTLSASVGTVIKNANGTWTWSYNTTDGPAQSQTVTITASDTQNATTQKTFALTVNNVPATLTGLSATAFVPNGPVTLSGSFQDPGAPDTHTGTVNWGDGSPTQSVTVDQIRKTLSATHTYATPGAYSVQVTLNDGQGGVTTQTITSSVAGAGLSNGVLKIYGTPGRDRVYVWRRDAGVRLEVEAAFNSETYSRYSFPSTSVNAIVMDLLDGNDLGLVDGGLVKDAVLMGGPGADQLYGGSGANVLSGGDGNDTLTGGQSVDILLGGRGRDQLSGKGGDDFLLGGISANENNSTALLSALSSWKLAQIANVLASLGTFTDDNETDILRGDLGNDYLVFGFNDTLIS